MAYRTFRINQDVSYAPLRRLLVFQSRFGRMTKAIGSPTVMMPLELWDAVPSSRLHMRGGGQLVATFMLATVALLLAPAAANAAPDRANSGVAYQNTFEHVTERDAWTKHNGDPLGFVGFDNSRPHSG